MDGKKLKYVKQNVEYAKKKIVSINYTSEFNFNFDKIVVMIRLNG